MTEKEKAKNGELYNPMYDKELIQERFNVKDLCFKYNNTLPSNFKERNAILKQILTTVDDTTLIEQPFICDYGYNIFIEKNVMLNYGCVILDVCPVKIGEHTLIGPNTHIYTACHSLVPDERISDIEFGKPVTIGKNVWIGGNCTILPGVTIGDNSVIGAGSVVTKDIPNNSVAVGNPAKVKSKN